MGRTPLPLSGGRKILPRREDLERLPFSFFKSSRSPQQVEGKGKGKGRGAPGSGGAGGYPVGGGGAPAPFSLPFEINFEDATLGTLDGWTQQGVDGIWTGTQGTAEVQNRIDAFGNDAPHSKAMFLEANKDTNIGSSISIDLGAPIDMSAGIRVAWYAKHYNEAAGGADAAIMLGPLLGDKGDDDQDWVRVHQQATSEEYARLQWILQDGTQKLNDQENEWMLFNTQSWRCYQYEINFAAGTGDLRCGNNSGSVPWSVDYIETFGFTPMVGPQNLQWLSIGSNGSSSGWKVYASLQIAQVWLGSLGDAWPVWGNIWSV